MVGYNIEHLFDNGWSVRQKMRYLHTNVVLKQVYAAGWLNETALNRGYSGSGEKMSAIALDNQLDGSVDTGAIRWVVVTIGSECLTSINFTIHAAISIKTTSVPVPHCFICSTMASRPISVILPRLRRPASPTKTQCAGTDERQAVGGGVKYEPQGWNSQFSAAVHRINQTNIAPSLT